MIRSTALTFVALCGVSLAAVADPLQAQSAGPASTIVLTAEGLEWHPAPSALPVGAEIAVLEGDPFSGPFTLRLRLPAGYHFPAHTHPLIENVTVISGAVHVGHGTELDRSRATRVGAGGFLSIPAGAPHYAWVEEPTVIQVHASTPFDIEYVDAAEDPRTR
jgi:hypothetical protein